jgi:hypothetical protein
MSKLPSKLIIISYRTGTPGDVLAEYADDKIRFSEKFGIKTFVITALGTNLLVRNSVRIFQVPSISHKDFNLELRQLRINMMPQPKWIKVYRVIPSTFGRLFDIFYRLINSELGYARWSWSINAVFVGVYVKIRYSVKHCFTVGSASAYLAGLILQKVTRIKLYIEVPDPIIGSEMARSIFKANLLEIFEKKLIKNSLKYLLITKRSYLDAVKRHPKLKERIFFNYPESWNFEVSVERNKNDQIQIVHLGSIYDNRNLDNWFLALDGLYEKKVLLPGEVQILNIGMSQCSNSENYLKRADYKLIDAQPRKIALEIASSADFLFLLQHTDSRSYETIPYKLYDYLNLGIPIIALINNSEISEILTNCRDSLMADVNDVKSIQVLIQQLKIIDLAEVDKDSTTRQFGQNFASIFM